MFTYDELEKWGLAQFLYLTEALMFLVGAVAVAMARRDLRRVILTTGPWGSAVEVYTDWRYYTHDYWRPPTVLPGHLAIVEDLIYGYGVTALAACAVAFWAPPPPWRKGQRRYQRGWPQDRGWAGLIGAGAIYAGGVEVFVRFGHLNSISAAAIGFGVIGLIGVALWPELWWVGPLAGLIMAAVDFIGYFVGLNLVVSDGGTFLQHVLLAHGPEAAQVPGTNVLISLLVWSFARGWCVAVVFPVVTGRHLRYYPRY